MCMLEYSCKFVSIHFEFRTDCGREGNINTEVNKKKLNYKFIIKYIQFNHDSKII